MKTLPVLERKNFLWAVLTLEEKSAPPARGKTRRVKWPDVEMRAPELVSFELRQRSLAAVVGLRIARGLCCPRSAISGATPRWESRL